MWRTILPCYPWPYVQAKTVASSGMLQAIWGCVALGAFALLMSTLWIHFIMQHSEVRFAMFEGT
jgi:hypothetical protein